VSEAQVRNVLWYVLIAVGAAVLTTGLQLGVVLSGDADILWRPLAATFVTTLFGTLATAAGTAFRPKAGREDISGLVSEVGPTAAKAALEDEAVRQTTGVMTPLSDDDIDRLARRGIELLHEQDSAATPDPWRSRPEWIDDPKVRSPHG
jgi:hypothetical protein